MDTSFVFTAKEDDTYIRNLGQSIMQYKNFKKLYVFDENLDMFKRKPSS